MNETKASIRTRNTATFFIRGGIRIPDISEEGIIQQFHLSLNLGITSYKHESGGFYANTDAVRPGFTACDVGRGRDRSADHQQSNSGADYETWDCSRDQRPCASSRHARDSSRQ